MKSSPTTLTTQHITHLGETDGGEENLTVEIQTAGWSLQGVRLCPASFPKAPTSKKKKRTKKERKKSNYSPSLTNPAGARHKQGHVKTELHSHGNRSLHLWLGPRCEVKPRPMAPKLASTERSTLDRRGCRKKKN